METVTEFLNKLASKGVKLSAEAGQLNCYAQKGALTNDLKDGIIKFKPELITLLERKEKRQSKKFPLSAGQKGLYILHKLHPGMSAYNVPLCFKISAGMNPAVMAKAWDKVLEQFPILTARVIEREGTLYQELDEGCRTTLQKRAIDFADDEQLLSFLQKQAKQPFDLNRGPLTRIELFTRPEQNPILLITVHHIVFDGTSVVILLRSLLEFYQQLFEGKPARLSQELTGYQEFVAWEEAMLASPEGAAHARYWQQQLDGAPPAVELPPDVPCAPSASFEGRTLVEDLPRDLSRWVREFSKSHSVPASVILLAVFQLLLHRYTNQDDIIVGMPVMGRAAQHFAVEVGYFINMVPLRTHCGGRIRLMEFLRKVQGNMLDALYHSSYPFPLMVERVKSRRADKSPIFRVSYAYQNFVNPADFMSLLEQQAFQLEMVAGIWQEGDFDLGLEIYEDPASSFSVHLKYNPALYTHEGVAGVFRHYCVLLNAVSENPNLFVHEYPWLDDGNIPFFGRIDLEGTAANLPVIPLNPNGKVDRRALARIILEQQLDYWKWKLAGVPESLELVTDYPSSSLQRIADATYSFTVSAELTRHLKRLAEQRGATLYMVLLATFKVLLHRYTGQTDICVGATFAKTPALRSQVDEEDTFSAFLSQVRATCLEACRHQDVPFEKVVDMLRPQSSRAISPIVQVMVILQNEPVTGGISKCDLIARFKETSEGLAGSFEYSTALYKPQTIARMAEHFIALCRAITAKPTAKIRAMDYLGEREKHQLLIGFNDTCAEYPRNKCIHQLFAEQVSISPDRTAVVCAGRRLSYQELYSKSRDLAVYLQSNGVKPDNVVGLCVERSLDMIVGIMGLLQAG